MFNVNFNTDDFRKIEDGLKKDIKDILAQPVVMREIGEFMQERIKFQARTEKPFSAAKVFPLLKESTIAHRRYLAKYNPTHPTFEDGRSNVTITGALLNSLTYIVKGPGKVALFFEGLHPGYKTKTGHTRTDIANDDIVKWLGRKGFTIFDQSISELKVVKGRVKSIALKYIRRGLKVRNRLKE